MPSEIYLLLAASAQRIIIICRGLTPDRMVNPEVGFLTAKTSKITKMATPRTLVLKSGLGGVETGATIRDTRNSNNHFLLEDEVRLIGVISSNLERHLDLLEDIYVAASSEEKEEASVECMIVLEE